MRPRLGMRATACATEAVQVSKLTNVVEHILLTLQRMLLRECSFSTGQHVPFRTGEQLCR